VPELPSHTNQKGNTAPLRPTDGKQAQDEHGGAGEGAQEDDRKQCAKCFKIFSVTMFKRDRTRSDGLFPYCKPCCKICHKKDYERHKESRTETGKRWAARNKEKVRAIKDKWANAHKDEISERLKDDRKQRPEVYKERAKSTYWNNREKLLAKNSEYRKAFHEKRKATVNKSYRKHRDHVLEYHHKRYREDPERHNAMVKDWGQRNPDKLLSYVHARRARRESNGGSYTADEWNALKAKYGHQCLCCGRKEPETRLTVDHVIPIAKGGRSSIDNIQPLCRPCNARKNVKEIDYREKYSADDKSKNNR